MVFICTVAAFHLSQEEDVGAGSDITLELSILK